MARTPNERTLIHEDFLRQFRAESTVLNAVDRSLESGFLNNSTQELQRFISGAKVRDITDVDGLETKPTDFVQPRTVAETWQIGYIQGYGQVNLRKAREMKAGEAARELELNSQISTVMAQNANQKGIMALGSNTYTNNVTSFSVGDSANYLDQSTGIEEEETEGAVAKLVNGALRRSKRYYTDQNIQGGVNVTGNQIPGYNILGNSSVVDNQAEYLADKGVLQTAGDIAVQSMTDRGVFSNTSYRGTSVGGFNWWGLPEDVMPAPTGTDPWDIFIVPSQGAVYGAFALDPDSEDTYRVNGTHLEERVETGLVAYRIFQPTWVIRIRIKSESS